MGKKVISMTEKELFFKRLSHQIDQLFDIEQRYITTHQDRLNFSSLLGGRRYHWGLGAVVEKQEGALFKLIAREGPIVLSHPDIQDKIKKWLETPYEASAKLNNMKDALLIYAIHLKRESVGKHVRGARKAEITQAIGTEKILEVYNLFLSRLKELRTFIRTRGNPADALLEWGNKLINDNKNAACEYAVKVLGARENEIETWMKCGRPGACGGVPINYPFRDKIIKSRDKQSDDLIRKLNTSVPPISVLQIIASGNFINEILDMDWTPSEMTKKIMAFEMGISESQLTKLLFLKKSHADKGKKLPA